MNKRMSKLEFARYLRQTSPVSEMSLWQMLRSRRCGKAKFRRQHPLGIYFADFYCEEHKLVIELDGAHHLTEEQKRYDQMRDASMNSQGIRVMRFTGKQVEMDPISVCEMIEEAIRKCSP